MSGILDEVGRIARSMQIPYHVMIEVTYACNLRCVMCYNPTHKAAGELTLAEYEDLFDQLVAAGTMQLTLTGGEPLARPDFFEIAEAARARHFALRVFTNGTRVTREVAQRIADLVPLSVEVPIYGATAATHDLVTGMQGSFDRTIEGIKHLDRVGAIVVAKTLITQVNKGEIEETADLIASLRVRFKGFDPVVFASHSGDPAPIALRVPSSEVATLLPFDLRDREDPFDGADGADDAMCSAALDFASITPHGDVYPCPSLRIPMGNVRQRPFAEVWRAPDSAEGIARVRAATWASLDSCSSCAVRGACQRCPGLAHHEDGDALGPSSTHCGLSFARVANSIEHADQREEQTVAG